MKVLLLNGSPRKNGNTAAALNEMVKVFEANGVETEIMMIGDKAVRGCIGCMSCRKTGKCVFDDVVNEASAKFKEADGLVIASPVYYASANGTMISFLDRLFYSLPFDATMKVGAAVAVARRAGTTATFDELNKYLTYGGMAVATSQYWNVVHGRNPGDAEKDIEGMQIMRTLAGNMVFLMKSIALGKEKYGLPEKEAKTMFDYIR